jgi:1-pyrroline-5-carboxylate dehydrogenase
MWRKISENLEIYGGYPRVVGETGGKDFVFVHPSAEVESTAVALLRGAYEYQGQKCSAASRAYVPESLWPGIRDRLLAMIGEIKMGEVEDFTTFMGAVIDRDAYERIRKYIEIARASSQAKVLIGGRSDDTRGFFVEPTLIETVNPRFQLMEEEIFGPVLTVYVYADIRLDEAVDLCATTSPYGLTGAVFARDREAIADLARRLVDAAGNFYVNDKPTGAVVGQQPFGGARASGTNDKAGSMANLSRWVSMRAIKETFDPPTRFEYPHMKEK